MTLTLRNSRREQLIRWYAWSLKYGDCDPAVWCTNYLHQRYEHNDEERLWFAWLYGNTYQLPTAWVLKNEFPDYELATVDRIRWWNSHNYKRLRYQTDTKWNKGHLPAMFESYQEFIGNRTQREVLENYYGDNEQQTFDNLWNNLKNSLYKFGRYSTWFYLQHLGVHEIELVVLAGEHLRDGGGVGDHAHGALHLGKITTGHNGRRLVVDAALEAGGAPVNKLDGALGLDGGNGGVDILGNNVTTEHEARSHVLAVTRVALDHH